MGTNNELESIKERLIDREVHLEMANERVTKLEALRGGWKKKANKWQRRCKEFESLLVSKENQTPGVTPGDPRGLPPLAANIPAEPASQSQTFDESPVNDKDRHRAGGSEAENRSFNVNFGPDGAAGESVLNNSLLSPGMAEFDSSSRSRNRKKSIAASAAILGAVERQDEEVQVRAIRQGFGFSSGKGPASGAITSMRHGFNGRGGSKRFIASKIGGMSKKRKLVGGGGFGGLSGKKKRLSKPSHKPKNKAITSFFGNR